MVQLCDMHCKSLVPLPRDRKEGRYASPQSGSMDPRSDLLLSLAEAAPALQRAERLAS